MGFCCLRLEFIAVAVFPEFDCFLAFIKIFFRVFIRYSRRWLQRLKCRWVNLVCYKGLAHCLDLLAHLRHLSLLLIEAVVCTFQLVFGRVLLSVADVHVVLQSFVVRLKSVVVAHQSIYGPRRSFFERKRRGNALVVPIGTVTVLDIDDALVEENVVFVVFYHIQELLCDFGFVCCRADLVDDGVDVFQMKIDSVVGCVSLYPSFCGAFVRGSKKRASDAGDFFRASWDETGHFFSRSRFLTKSDDFVVVELFWQIVSERDVILLNVASVREQLLGDADWCVRW